MRQLPARPMTILVVLSMTLCGAATPQGNNRNRRAMAVSLRELARRSAQCQSAGGCPAEILHIAGLKLVTGFLRDDQGQDLILLGESNPDLPSLWLEDLVVALRSAWFKYAERRGNSILYTAPGCSIDPNPEVLTQLQSLAQAAMQAGTPQAARETLQRWNEICAGGQKVRVLGVPFDSHMASVMVAADYKLKNIVNGSQPLQIPHFPDLSEMTMREATRRLKNGQATSLSMSVLTRFWFSPHEISVEEDEGAVWIKRCRVGLLTEEEHFQGATNPSAGGFQALPKEFANRFGRRFEEIAEVDPIYAELAGLFRFALLAQVLKLKAPTATETLLQPLLSGLELSHQQVPSVLPGRPSSRESSSREEIPGGYREAFLWLPSCGGVDMGVTLTDKDFRPNLAGDLRRQRELVLASRPSPDSLAWDYPSPPPAYIEQTRKNNIRSQTTETLLLIDSGSKYALFGEGTGLIYEGLGMAEMIDAIRKHSNRVSQVFVQTLGFSSDRREKLLTSLKVQEYSGRISALETGGVADAWDIYFAHGCDLRQTVEVEKIGEGPRAGFYRAAFQLSRGVKSLLFDVFSKSERVLREFCRSLVSRFSADTTAADVVSQLKSEIMKERGLTDEQFYIELTSEITLRSIVNNGGLGRTLPNSTAETPPAVDMVVADKVRR